MPSTITKKAALKRLFKPRHIAVFGGDEAAEVVRQCERLGFAGPIWPVHPRRREIAGRTCFKSVAELPLPPDASFIAVPPVATVEVVELLAQRGGGGAVCYAAGFAEAGAAGEALQRRLLEAAGGLALIGPNCYGLLNYLDGVALWPDQHGGRPVERGVAIVSQSGNIAISLSMQQRAVPLAFLVSVGNQADLGVHDCLDALLDDPRIQAIGLYIESLSDIAAFSLIACRAQEKRVPLVALKAGGSELGASTALSHTRSLVGSDVLYQTLFERLGVGQVQTLPQLLETLKLLAVVGPLPQASVASISCSGGEAALVADLAQAAGVRLPPLTGGQREALRAVLGERVALANPLDYHTYIWGQTQRQRECFAAMLEGEQALTLKVLDFPKPGICDTLLWQAAVEAFGDAVRQTGRRGALVSTLPENLPPAVAERLAAAGIAPMQGLQECLTAVRAAAAVGRGAREVVVTACRQGEPEVLDEWRSKQLLHKHGVPIPQSRRVCAARAAAAAREVGFPVAVKALAEGLVHKSEAGAVKLGLEREEQVRGAVAAMAHLSDVFLVEQMISDGVAEVIVGAHRDVQFGLCMLVGAGGVWVELLQDSVPLLLPITTDDIHAALRRLKLYPLLRGYRGRAEADVDALVAAVAAVARFLQTEADSVLELDINPLVIRPRGHGVVAADALIRRL